MGISQAIASAIALSDEEDTQLLSSFVVAKCDGEEGLMSVLIDWPSGVITVKRYFWKREKRGEETAVWFVKQGDLLLIRTDEAKGRVGYFAMLFDPRNNPWEGAEIVNLNRKVSDLCVVRSGATGVSPSIRLRSLLNGHSCKVKNPEKWGELVRHRPRDVVSVKLSSSRVQFSS